jgi:hypothetical protein
MKQGYLSHSTSWKHFVESSKGVMHRLIGKFELSFLPAVKKDKF